ncbi:MAG: AraC family transcriptional regulator [Chloroflexota bacterium]
MPGVPASESPGIPAMLAAIDFIEANLKEEIAVADVAEAVSYSLFHFCRMFNRIVQHTPYDYLIRRRLAESARVLVESEYKIADVAFDFRFHSAETYSRAFKRVFGMQPFQWKQQGFIDRRALMPRLTSAHLEHINRAEIARPKLVIQPAICLAGMMTQVKGERVRLSGLWEMLEEELRNSESTPVGYYGVAFYPSGWQEHGCLYLAGAQVDAERASHSALVTKTIPAGRYAQFSHAGSYQAVALTLDYIYHTWLPKSGECLSGTYEIEIYGEANGAVRTLSPQYILMPI